MCNLEIVYNPEPELQGKNAALEIYLLFSIFSSCNCANRRSGRSSWAEAVSVNSAALGTLFSWPDSMLIPGIMETLQRFLKELEDFTLDLGEEKKKAKKWVWVWQFSPLLLLSMEIAGSENRSSGDILLYQGPTYNHLCVGWERNVIWTRAGIQLKERDVPNTFCSTAEQQLSFQEGRLASLWTWVGKWARLVKSQILQCHTALRHSHPSTCSVLS